MPDSTFLDWPFLEESHRAWARDLKAFARERFADLHEPSDRDALDAACREILSSLATAGITHAAVPAPWGGRTAALDVRTLCLTREILAYESGLADFVFAMQGLGAGPISIAGSDAQRSAWLPAVAAGKAIAAFAISEPDAGSDVAAMATTAERDGDGYVVNGTKTWISNGGIADVYTLFARTGEAPGARGISAFVVPADTPGLKIAERIDVIAPHPLATLTFDDMRLPAEALIGAPGEGFKTAMGTLDVFRATVGAAALGFARRAHDEALARAVERHLFGAPMSELQLVQAKLADMALDVDASALLVYRSAWTKDTTGARVTREASMAKLHATEAAQRAADAAVQIFGGLGVRVGQKVEELYREVRALRIYEGASEVQKVVIAREALKRFEADA